MSIPARKLPASTPRPQRAVRRPPRTSPAPAPGPARRKKHHLGFALFAATIVGLMVFATVVLHVLLAQQSFRIDEAGQRLDALARSTLELVRVQATLSAPDRIADWASRHGMRLPDDIRILRAPDDPVAPAGAGTSSDTTSPSSDPGAEG